MRGLVNAGQWVVIGLVFVSIALDATARHAGVQGVRVAPALASTTAPLKPVGEAGAASLLQTSSQAHALAQAQAGSHSRARARIVQVSAEDGAGLDTTPHFAFADSNVDSELLDELNNMLIQTQARAVREHCQLLGNWFGYIVQLTLGVIAFGALIVKKYMDSKTRDWMTWARDTSKQAIGSIVAHCWNLLFATLLQSRADEDPCVYYLINYLVDAVLGCVLSLLMLWGLDTMADKYDWDSFRSGDYGPSSDQHTVWKRWGAQIGAWIGIITISKLMLLFAFIVPAKHPLYEAGAWMMSGLVNYPRWELVIVMIIIPLVLNVVQFWISDNFLMSHDTTSVDTTKFHAAPTSAPPSVPPPAQPPASSAPASVTISVAAASATASASSSSAAGPAVAEKPQESQSLLAAH